MNRKACKLVLGACDICSSNWLEIVVYILLMTSQLSLVKWKIKVLILGVCLEIFFLEKRVKKLGCILYTGVHYTQVDMVLPQTVVT